MHIEAEYLSVKPGDVGGRAYPTGKAYFGVAGPAGYETEVIRALGDALEIRVTLDVARLRQSLTRQGVPADAVEALCAGANVNDESYLRFGSRT